MAEAEISEKIEMMRADIRPNIILSAAGELLHVLPKLKNLHTACMAVCLVIAGGMRCEHRVKDDASVSAKCEWIRPPESPAILLPPDKWPVVDMIDYGFASFKRISENDDDLVFTTEYHADARLTEPVIDALATVFRMVVNEENVEGCRMLCIEPSYIEDGVLPEFFYDATGSDVLEGTMRIVPIRTSSLHAALVPFPNLDAHDREPEPHSSAKEVSAPESVPGPAMTIIDAGDRVGIMQGNAVVWSDADRVPALISSLAQRETRRLLEERGKTHGDVSDVGEMVVAIRNAMRTGRNWNGLAPAQKYALDEVAMKLARYLNGDMANGDHLADAIGYLVIAMDGGRHE